MLTTKPFGAFVELHGYRTHGLVHISQLAQFRVEAVEDVVQPGNWVRVKVISVENGRLSMSMRCVDQQTGEEILYTYTYNVCALRYNTFAQRYAAPLCCVHLLCTNSAATRS